MSTWPNAGMPPAVTITPYSLESIGPSFPIAGGAVAGSLASATWPVANTAYYVPFAVGVRTSVLKAFWYNGTAVSGNVDVGIYNEGGTRLASSGSTAQASTSVLQFVTLTPQLAPGVYYMALALDNTTGTIFRMQLQSTPLCAALGMAEQTSAFALPAAATFATMATNTVPFFGITARSF